MAEVIAAGLIKVVFEKLGDQSWKQIVGAWGIESEIKNLADPSDKIIGREVEKKELLYKLLGDERKNKFSVVPIVGMGGVGKTTLARSLYNDTIVKDYFQLHAWVCVSDDFDVFKITETIFRAMASEMKEFKELNEVQIALSDQLKEKRFLIVLDDIWSETLISKWRSLTL